MITISLQITGLEQIEALLAKAIPAIERLAAAIEGQEKSWIITVVESAISDNELTKVAEDLAPPASLQAETPPTPAPAPQPAPLPPVTPPPKPPEPQPWDVPPPAAAKPPRNNNDWTDRRRERLRVEWERGDTVQAIHHSLNCIHGPRLSESAIIIKAAAMGLQRPTIDGPATALPFAEVKDWFRRAGGKPEKIPTDERLLTAANALRQAMKLPPFEVKA